MSDKKEKIDSFLEGAGERRRREYDDWDAPKSRPTGGRGNLWGVGILIGLAVIAVILFLVIKEMNLLKGSNMGGERIIEREKTILGDSAADTLKIDQGKYQAVFLTNGQVYFGKVSSHNSSYIEVVDIYYLQVRPVLQQSEEQNNTNSTAPAEQKTELSLVKLGNELHGPLDRMMINKDQVVFIEDLKDDSKVTDAIKRYQQGQK